MQLNSKNIKKYVTKAWANYPQWFVLSGFAVLIAVWLGAIMPLAESKTSKQEALLAMGEELSAVKSWAKQIKELESNLSVEQQVKSSESLLQQVERLGKETKVFHKISRISPSKIRVDGREYEGIALEYEKTSMAELAPFLDAISYRSILNIHEITLQKYAEEEGIISARLTLVGGKI
jgi:type II secretory pathway component PulM